VSPTNVLIGSQKQMKSDISSLRRASALIIWRRFVAPQAGPDSRQGSLAAAIPLLQWRPRTSAVLSWPIRRLRASSRLDNTQARNDRHDPGCSAASGIGKGRSL